MGIDLVTYCSGDYLPAVTAMGPSWLRSGLDRVFVYTDTGVCPEIKGITFRKLFDRTIDKAEHCRRKAKSLQAHMNKFSADCVLLDADCYVVSPLNSIMANTKDIVVTTTEPCTTVPMDISAGFVAGKCGETFKRFVDEWVFLQNLTGEEGNSINSDQIGLDATARKMADHITLLPSVIYNNYALTNFPKDRNRWLANIRRHAGVISILHFAYGQWKDHAFLEEAIRLCHT